MHFPITIVEAITADRIRDAEAARRTQQYIPEQPEQPQRARRIRSLASRLAFSVTR